MQKLKLTESVPVVGFLKITIRDAKTGKIKSVDEIKNLVTNVARNSWADHARGITENNKGIITYCAVGTDSTAPVAANTTLGTEIERKLISTREISSGALNAAVFTTFFNTSEANGSLKEVGLFGDDATVTADSGTMFTHAAIDRTKSTADTLTAEYTVIIG